MTARTTRLHASDPRGDDAQILDEFDDLVTLACDGDRRALGAIAIAFGARLFKEARQELGHFKQDAGTSSGTSFFR